MTIPPVPRAAADALPLLDAGVSRSAGQIVDLPERFVERVSDPLAEIDTTKGWPGQPRAIGAVRAVEPAGAAHPFTDQDRASSVAAALRHPEVLDRLAGRWEVLG